LCASDRSLRAYDVVMVRCEPERASFEPRTPGVRPSRPGFAGRFRMTAVSAWHYQCPLRASFAGAGPLRVSTLTTTDIPGRSTRCIATDGGTCTRTGRRCTILVKLPVALSGGSSENTEPEAG